jgi:hypothetical protein
VPVEGLEQLPVAALEDVVGQQRLVDPQRAVDEELADPQAGADEPGDERDGAGLQYR